MSFSLFFQSLINGLNQGAIYALIALGYTMVYGIIRMINFAHGDFIMIGAYTLFYTIPLMVNAGMPAWLAVIVAIAVCAVVGVLVETFAYRPVRKAGPMSALITALAMSIFLENLAMDACCATGQGCVHFGGHQCQQNHHDDLCHRLRSGCRGRADVLCNLPPCYE